MKKIILLVLTSIISSSVRAGAFLESATECYSDSGAISKLYFHVKNTGIYKKDRIKGAAEFADLSYVVVGKEKMCQYNNLKLSLTQFRSLLGSEPEQFSFPMELRCLNSDGSYKLSGQVTIDSTKRFAEVVYMDEAGLKSVSMKCESKSLLDRITDAITPQFGS